MTPLCQLHSGILATPHTHRHIAPLRYSLGKPHAPSYRSRKHGIQTQRHAAASGSSELHPSPKLPLGVGAFPVALISMVTAALTFPQAFTWYSIDATVSLGTALFAITIATPMEELASFKNPKRILVSLASGLLAWPLLGLLITLLVPLPAPLAVGVILLAACPPGTASNVVAGHVSRSHLEIILITTLQATLLGNVLYPATVNALGDLSTHNLQLALSSVGSSFTQHALKGILLPVAAAVAAKKLLPGPTQAVAKFMPALACCCILATAPNKTALMSGVIQSAGLGIAVLVFAWHGAATLLGYGMAKVAGAPERLARTAAIQAGERNPALGLGLAAMVSADPLVLVPCAISVFAQNVLITALTSVYFWGPRRAE